MRLSLIFAAACLMFGATPAVAQDEAERAILAERLVDATVRDGLDKALQRIVDDQIAESTMPEEQTRWMSTNMAGILAPHLATMIDETESLYAERLSLEQLTALVDFYDTPDGRAIAALQFDLSAEVGVLMGPVMEAYLTELITKFCAAFDCPGLEAVQASGKD